MSQEPEGREVITVLGAIRPEEMGLTYTHEHLFLDYQPEWVRADNVAALVKEGFGAQVLLSEDICSLRHLKYAGGKGYGYLLEVFVPLLRERGMSEEQVQQLLITNPARVFARRCAQPKGGKP